tara:strand:- start:1210 stop:1449 length:240 start_codon:yes stop_codon:yes gene_type:complete
MMELNQNIILTAIAVIGVLVFYYLHREMKRTQLDVQGLKVFSANVASYMEPPKPPDNMPAVPEPVPPPTASTTEEKEDK